jgi:hypothetical protein
MNDASWFLIMAWEDRELSKALTKRPQIIYRGDLIEVTFEEEIYILPANRIRRLVLTRTPELGLTPEAV